jgi:hypothetical protein
MMKLLIVILLPHSTKLRILRFTKILKMIVRQSKNTFYEFLTDSARHFQQKPKVRLEPAHFWFRY